MKTVETLVGELESVWDGTICMVRHTDPRPYWAISFEDDDGLTIFESEGGTIRKALLEALRLSA